MLSAMTRRTVKKPFREEISCSKAQLSAALHEIGLWETRAYNKNRPVISIQEDWDLIHIDHEKCFLRADREFEVPSCSFLCLLG